LKVSSRSGRRFSTEKRGGGGGKNCPEEFSPSKGEKGKKKGPRALFFLEKKKKRKKKKKISVPGKEGGRGWPKKGKKFFCSFCLGGREKKKGPSVFLAWAPKRKKRGGG